MIIEQVIIKEEELSHWTYRGQFKSNDQLLITLFFQHKTKSVEKTVADLFAQFPNAIMVGCSGAGEVASDFIYDHHLIATLVRYTGKALTQWTYPIAKGKSEDLSKDLALKINKEKANGLLIFSDGLLLDGAQFAHGLKTTLKSPLPIIGGMAGDGTQFKETFVVSNGQLKSGILVAVALKGKLHMAPTASGGWKRFGFEHKITKVKDNVVYEIDGKKALDFYREHLGPIESNKLPASGLHFPLNVLNENETVVRTLLAIDEKEKSLTFAGSIKEGSIVDVMKSTTKDLVQCSETNRAHLEKEIPPQTMGQVLSLVVSCVGRRLAMGEKTEDELQGHLENKKRNITQTGFYSYGEFSSTVTSLCSLQNQTLTQAYLWEEEESEAA